MKLLIIGLILIQACGDIKHEPLRVIITSTNPADSIFEVDPWVVDSIESFDHPLLRGNNVISLGIKNNIDTLKKYLSKEDLDSLQADIDSH
jgi:hypothetical protein